MKMYIEKDNRNKIYIPLEEIVNIGIEIHKSKAQVISLVRKNH